MRVGRWRQLPVLPAEAGVTAARPRPRRHGTIYVLLPVHDRRAVTEQFVRCLLDQTDQDFQLVLIDDGSTDGTAEAVTALLPTTTVLRGDGSWWWAGSLQQGLSVASSTRHRAEQDVVLIANDDTRFDADFLAAGRAALAGSRRRCSWRSCTPTAVRRVRRARGPRQLAAAQVQRGQGPRPGQLLFDPRPVHVPGEFVALGGFHPRLLPHYLSDYEFTIRAQRQGLALVSDPGVRLWYDPTTTGIRTVLGHRSVALPALDADEALGRTTRSGGRRSSCWHPPERLPAGNLFRVWRRFASGLRPPDRRSHAAKPTVKVHVLTTTRS